MTYNKIKEGWISLFVSQTLSNLNKSSNKRLSILCRPAYVQMVGLRGYRELKPFLWVAVGELTLERCKRSEFGCVQFVVAVLV